MNRIRVLLGIGIAALLSTAQAQAQLPIWVCSNGDWEFHIYNPEFAKTQLYAELINVTEEWVYAANGFTATRQTNLRAHFDADLADYRRVNPAPDQMSIAMSFSPGGWNFCNWFSCMGKNPQRYTPPHVTLQTRQPELPEMLLTLPCVRGPGY